MNTILVPTDFSQNSSDALYYISKVISTDNPTRFILVYSFEPEMSSLTTRVDAGKSEQVLDMLYKQADKEGEDFLKASKERIGATTHVFEYIATSMSLPRAINALIKKEKVMLAVMGTKGRTAAENILMGSTTASMIKKIKGAPLLVVPSQLHFEAPLKIGYATDFNDPIADEHLRVLDEISKNFNASIEIVTVKTENAIEQKFKNEKQFSEKMKDFKTHYHLIPKNDSIAKSLQGFIEDEKIDLFTMVFRKHNPIFNFLREPVVKKVGNTIKMPYLLMHVN